MFRHPLIVMSLSGSAVVALYGLFYPVIKRHLSISWQRTILKSAIFFYLFPLPLFKEAIWSFVYDWFPVLAAKNVDTPKQLTLDFDYAVNLQPGNIFFGPGVLLMGVFICCMGAITFFILAKQLKQYLTISRTYRSAAFSEQPSSFLVKQFEQMKETLGIKRKVGFVCSQFCKTPITIGVFSPTIVFPADNASGLEPSCYTYILKHELLHIKNRDPLVKFLSLIVLALHWYNPICYFFYREINVVCEINCDHEVVRDSDKTQRQRYSSLILELATNNYTEKYAVGLVNGNAAAFKRRILEMKTNRNSKSLLSCAIMIAVCLIGSMTAFAYEAPQIYEIEGFNPNGDHRFSSSSIEEKVPPIPSNHFFTDIEGNMYPANINAPKIGCKHQLVEGTYSHHQKTASGGCITTVSKAWRCSLCGYMKIGDIISETKYTICPH